MSHQHELLVVNYHFISRDLGVPCNYVLFLYILVVVVSQAPSKERLCALDVPDTQLCKHRQFFPSERYMRFDQLRVWYGRLMSLFIE